jgi:hypothetical protein
VKAEVDEKDLDEEIAKIKDRLAARNATSTSTARPTPQASEDDFFNSIPSARRRSEDEMSIDQPQKTRKRPARDTLTISDDEFDRKPTKKSRTTQAVRAPAKKTPARASRAKAVFT